MALFSFREKKTTQVTFRMFGLIVRFSKYDFWNLGEISDLKNIFSKKIFYFSKSKKISKKSEILKKWDILGILRIFNGFP